MIEEKSIIIKAKEKSFFDYIVEKFNAIDVKGKVVDENGIPLYGAAVTIKGGKGTRTDKEGNFYLPNVDEKAVVQIFYLGYITQELKATSNFSIIKLELSYSKLDEVQVIPYGTVQKRLNTGNVTTVSGEDLAKAPVSNALFALENRVPGLVITQSSGVPGSSAKVQIRGRTRIDLSIGADDTPLFIIDGVPMASGNANLNLLSSANTTNSPNYTGGLSPFSLINTSDIESIEVLKDADATSIYGSRGASGVILITTKKGKAGKTNVNIKMTSGFSKAQIPDLLTTSEYVAMRKEAFKNDNIIPNVTNAYDILLWDTTRTTNLAKELIGGTATYNTVDAGLSGGSELVNYSLRGSYLRETNVYPKPMPNTRASVFMNLNGKSANQKFTFAFVGSYVAGKNQSPASDLSSKITLPPHYQLYNADGSLAWNEAGRALSDNPLAYQLQMYTAQNNNLSGNILLGYKIIEGLTFKTSVGYNVITTDEIKNIPIASLNPTVTPRTGVSNFGESSFKSWITEPQLEYIKDFGKGKLNVLLGGTIQSQKSLGSVFTIRDYASDNTLGTFIGVPSTAFINASNTQSDYKYAAIFGRVNYNYMSKYLINISGRRDGSSRFGPNYRYSTFAAVGGAWIFTEENILKDNKILSFGKLRGSYGTTGNDKIGDYKYLDLYGVPLLGNSTYKDSVAISPLDLFKPDLHWEMNKKLEIALDLGFLKDRIIFSGAWYRNRSSDPLVQYPLPGSTGFASVAANLNGVIVENSGFEFLVTSTNIRNKSFNWNTSFNITFAKNKLYAYPGLAQTSYASTYIIGKPLNIVYIANFTGVDPKTGLYTVEDINKNGTFNVTNLNGDLAPDFSSDPEYYGGIQNDFRYKGFNLSVFLSFNKGYVQNWRTIAQATPVGSILNVSSDVLRRWQKEGDVTDVQKFTTISQAQSLLSGSYQMSASDAKYSDVFWLRMRTVELSYQLPKTLMQKLKINAVNIFVQGQNLFTITPFRGADPETMFINRLAPLTTMVAGFQINL